MKLILMTAKSLLMEKQYRPNIGCSQTQQLRKLNPTNLSVKQIFFFQLVYQQEFSNELKMYCNFNILDEAFQARPRKISLIK